MANLGGRNSGVTAAATIVTSSSRPSMDRLTHSVIKETSKSLKYYIDVKRRENAFVLNPNSSLLSDSVPLKARLIYGTTKEYPPLYASCHTDNDVKLHLRSMQQEQPRQAYATSTSSPEKQMCREELNFHMRAYNFMPGDGHKFGELRLRHPNRSSSSCSAASGRDLARRVPKSSFKLTRHEQDQLLDDTANILAAMVKTRRSIYETAVLAQQTPAMYVSRNVHTSPRQTDDQAANVRSVQEPLSPSLNQEAKRRKRTTENVLAKAAAIMHKAKPITKGFLCEYKVSITTGNCNGASTNAPIRLKLYGTNGYTNFIELTESETHRVPFVKDQTDLFTVQTHHVGQLVGVTIGHDRKDMRASWFLNKISIDDPIRDVTYDIPCNAWLSSKANDQKTMRDFQVVSMVSHKDQDESDEHREEVESQSDTSTTVTTTTEGTAASSTTTNASQNELSTDREQSKKNRKQRVSIGPTTVARKPSIATSATDDLARPPPPATIESHFHRSELPPSRPVRSPIIDSSSDTEIVANVSRTHSSTPTPSPTLNRSPLQSISEHNTLPEAARLPPATTTTTTTTANESLVKRHSIDYSRPPARLEKRSPPPSVSPERSMKTKEETNELDSFFFFD